MKKAIIPLAFICLISLSVILFSQQQPKGSSMLSFFLNSDKTQGMNEKEIENAFIDFISKYQKTYASRSHTQEKYQTFKDNYLKIKEHNERNGNSYKLGINKFSDMTEEEFLKIYQTQTNDDITSTQSDKRYLHDEISFLQKESDLRKRVVSQGRFKPDIYNPDRVNFDYNDYDYIDTLESCDNADWIYQRKVSKVKNQQTCSASWSHSAIGTIEIFYAIYNQITDPELLLSFSEQQLIDCDKNPNYGCVGGRRQYAFNYIKENGITTEDKYPYNNGNGDCNYTNDMKTFQIDHFKAYERMLNSDLMTLSCQGPVSVSIRINECLKNYQSGIIYDGDGSCGCSQAQSTNHNVVLLGFQRDESNTICPEFWILKNSWGSDWGENGFFRLCKSDDDNLPNGTCNIRYEAMIALKQ